MKTFLAIIGALALVIIIGIVALGVAGTQRIKPLLKEAHAYVDESVPAIATEWKGDELYGRAATELRELLEGGALDQIMQAGAFQLGAMISAEPATCELARYEYTEQGEFATASCRVDADFEKATAEILVNILKREGQWRIFGFFITPKEAKDGVVTVAYPVALPAAQSNALNRFEVSLQKRSIGLTSGASEETGASIISAAKIENIE